MLQGTAPGILGGLVKGLKVGKADRSFDSTKTPISTFNQLEVIFLKSPHSGLSPSVDHQEDEELNIGPLQVPNSLHFFKRSFFVHLQFGYLLVQMILK